MSLTRRLAVTAERDHRDQLGGVAADDRTAEHLAGGRVGDDLHEAARVVVDQRLGGGGERHLRDADLAARRERLGLGEADVGDLGLGEDRRGRLVVVEVAVLDRVQAHHVLGHLAALHRRHRRQRQLAADVAGRVDVRHVGDAVVVDRDVAAGGRPRRRRLEARARRCSAPSRSRARRGSSARRGRRRSARRRRRRRRARSTSARAPLSSLTPRCMKSSSSTAATSGSLPGSTSWRLTTSVTLEPSDENMWTNSTPVTPEPMTVMLLGDHLRRVAVAGGEDAVAVGLAPVGDARARSGGDRARRRTRCARRPSAPSTCTRVRAGEPGGAHDHAHALARRAGRWRCAAGGS